MRIKRKNRIFLIMLLSLNSFIQKANTYYPGILCTIEGVDGSGKSTLLANLKSLFKETNIPLFYTREPGATNLGKKLRNILLNQEFETSAITEFLLFAADRAQHFQEYIIPKLQQGYLILSDRMADSSLAYQGYLKGLDINMISIVNSWCMQQIQPDITVYLKISADDARKRITTTRTTSDKFEEKSLMHLEKLIDAFDTIFAHRDTILIIDAMQDPHIIAQQIFQAIINLYQKKHANE